VPASFQFDVLYNDQLNTCVVSTAPCTAGDCLDSNPDANAGTSKSSTPSFGDNAAQVDCNVGGSAPASCDLNPTVGVGDAFLKCINSGATNRTLPYGDGVSAPIAVISFHAAAGGTDTLSFSTTSKVVDPGYDNTVWCAPGDDAVGTCVGATDEKSGDTPVPVSTATRTPTARPTSTPFCALTEGYGLPTCEPTKKAFTKTPTTAPTETATEAAPPPSGGEETPAPSGGPAGNVIPPNTGDGSSGVPWFGSLFWAVSGVAAMTVIGGGLYLGRDKMRR
jgi:hypothetical protein